MYVSRHFCKSSGSTPSDRARDLALLGADTFAGTADLCDHEQARALVQQVLPRFSRIDILVNNAGMTQVGRPGATATLPLTELPEQDWDYSIAINLKTAFNVTKAVLPAMLNSGYGRIVNIASTTGTISSNPRETAYSAAKAGMVGLTRSLRSRLPVKESLLTQLGPAGSKPAPPRNPNVSPGRIPLWVGRDCLRRSPPPLHSSPPNRLPTLPANSSSLTEETAFRNSKVHRSLTTELRPGPGGSVASWL